MSLNYQYHGEQYFSLFARVRSWSDKTFGSKKERGPIGPLKHLAKEAKEAAEKPDDKVEYADCLIVLLDACWRAGITSGELLRLAHEKMKVNETRIWPKPTEPDQPIEHDRTLDT